MPIHVTVRRVIAAVGVCAVLTAAAGCADTSEPTGGLAIVVGARSNMPAPVLAGQAAAALDEAVNTEARFSLVVADGEPHEVQGGRLDTSEANAQAEQRDRERLREEIHSALDAARARTPESDLLSALDIAARKLDSASGSHTVVVLDSGLSTAGVLDFAAEPALLDEDPEGLANDLEAADQLPDLSGMTVVFQGLGDTFAPQPVLSRPERSNLIAIWSAIVRAAGGEVVVEQSPLDQPPVTPLPSVTPVLTDGGTTCTVTLTSSDVTFQPDSVELLDEIAAAKVLAPIATQLTRAGVTALLTGTTADVGDPAGQVELSRLRAQAVKGVLAELGAPEERMTVVGLGSDFPGYTQDHDASGQLITEAAEANRKVFIELAGGSDLDCS